MIRAFLDVGPLSEEMWTGIPNVTAELAVRTLSDSAITWSYMYETVEVEAQIVRQLLERRTGRGMLSYLEQRSWLGHRLRRSETAGAAGVFLNVKAIRSWFAREALVVHDLSTLLTPEFHHQDTIDHHVNRLRSDIESTETFFCVSQATADDLQTYFKVPADRLRKLPLGVTFDPCDLAALARDRFVDCEPFVTVLATIEPRKNGSLVFDFLRSAPSFLRRYKVVFVGRDGWLGQKERLLEELLASGARDGRVIFSDFVTDRVKTNLLYRSQFCIYPSFFEGFGIPILEAAVLGKYVACSNTSSMGEVAPENCFFFDPTDLVSFARAISGAEAASQASMKQRSSFADIWSRALARSYDPAYAALRSWVLSEGAPA